MVCVICTADIPAPRLAVQPRVKTCSPECSKLLRKEHGRAAARRARERNKKDKQR